MDFTRIKQLMFLDIVVNKRRMLAQAAGLTCIALILTYLTASSHSSDFPAKYASYYVQSVSNIYSVLFCLWLSLSLARFSKGMKSRAERINVLSLPATTAEKYTARLSMAVFSPVVLFMVALPIAEVLRLVVMWLEGQRENPTFHFLVWEAMGQSVGSGFRWNMTRFILNGFDYVLMALWYVFVLSCFLMGGCLWYKHPFLKTLVSLTGGMFVLLFLLGGFIQMGGEGLEDWLRCLPEYHFLWIRRALAVLMALASVGLWVGSYRVFAGRQVISPKRAWSNLLKRKRSL